MTLDIRRLSFKGRTSSVKRLVKFNIMSETATEIHLDEIELPSILSFGVNIFLNRFFYFIAAGSLPFLALVFTSISEYSIKSAGVSAWMHDSTAFSIFQLLILAIRFFAFGAMLAACVWLTGDIIFGDPNLAPSLNDALTTGWKRAGRIVFSTLFIWVMITIYAQFALIFCKAMWVIFLPAGYFAASAAFILASLWAILPVAILIGKFIFAIPLVVFEEIPSMPAVFFSSKLVSFKFVVWKWPVILFCGVLLFLTIVIPSWTYIDSFVNIMTFSKSPPAHNLKIQIAGAAWMLITGPIAVSILTAFYFINSPRYWTEEANETNTEKND